MLIKEIISIAPAGKVNPLVYKLSSARVSKQVGMNIIRQIYDQELERVTDPQLRKYCTFMDQQILQTHQRFVNELPLLEAALQEEDLDLSRINIGIFGQVDRDGKLIKAPSFL